MADCPPGMHSHIGADGKRQLKCHPTSEKHNNPTAQRYHEMALATSKGANRNPMGDEDYEEEQKKPKYSPEVERQMKQNKAQIKAFLKKLTQGHMGNLFLPLSAMMITYDTITQQAEMYKARAKSNKEKAIADNYSKATDELVQILPEKSIDDWTEDDLEAVQSNLSTKMAEYGKTVKQKGRNCPEYGYFKAYWDYLNMCQEKADAISERVGAVPPEQSSGTIDWSTFFDDVKAKARAGMGNVPQGSGAGPMPGYQ